MIGIVLAAGGGTRLRPLTDDRPKTDLAVDGARSILELAIANLADHVDEVVLVVGHAAGVLELQAPMLADRYGVAIDLVFNDRHAEANNAYSLWLARDRLAGGALLVNGDTVHPGSVERTLLAADDAADVTLAADRVKPLAEEEMKLVIDADDRVVRITKQQPAAEAQGEYIGVARIHAGAGPRLAEALEATFERDPGQYYEDGFQELIDRGGHVRAAAIGDVDWVEVDDHDDLARARALPHPL